MTTAEKVRAVLAEQMGLDDGAVTNDALLDEDLGADSLDVVEIAMALEAEFNLREIDAIEAERWSRVAQVIAYVERHAR